MLPVEIQRRITIEDPDDVCTRRTWSRSVSSGELSSTQLFENVLEVTKCTRSEQNARGKTALVCVLVPLPALQSYALELSCLRSLFHHVLGRDLVRASGAVLHFKPFCEQHARQCTPGPVLALLYLLSGLDRSAEAPRRPWPPPTLADECERYIATFHFILASTTNKAKSREQPLLSYSVSHRCLLRTESTPFRAAFAGAVGSQKRRSNVTENFAIHNSGEKHEASVYNPIDPCVSSGCSQQSLLPNFRTQTRTDTRHPASLTFCHME